MSRLIASPLMLVTAMPRCYFPAVVPLALALAAWLAGVASAKASDDAERAGLELFERHVRPLLVEQCQSCHGGKKQESGLRLDSREAMIRGGDNGPAIVPGKIDEGLLIEAVRRSGSIQMPPEGKLTEPQIASLAAWIKVGAPWPKELKTAEPTIREKTATHWSFQPIADPPLPAIRNVAWPRDPLDHFILAKLEAAGLTPSPEASLQTLLRRLHYDLIGLPPTVEEVTSWEKEKGSDERIYRLVSRLLASPQHGERWARHWLDVARYADTKGYGIFGDREFPWAYTYRDYVIRALNEDLPYDRFILEQLAADQLDPPVEPWARAAVGFITLGPRFIDNAHDINDDRIDVVSRGLMGLTVSCARCHDHKFDPITSRDYYGLYSVFASCFEPIVPPLVAAEPTSAGYQEFARELQLRQQKLSDFIQQKHDAVVQGARSRAGEYLLAAHAQRGKPRQDDFMLLADETDLNPLMIVRWSAYLERTRIRRDPVFAVWHRFAELPPENFTAQRDALLAEWSSAASAHPTIRWMAARLTSTPPQNLADVANFYGRLFKDVDERWQAALREHPTVQRLDDPHEEALRQVLYAADAPPQFPFHPSGNLELIPDRKSQGTWRELLKEIETFRAAGPFAPPRAMSLVDLSHPHETRVFLRGNPNQLGDPAPRQFPAFLNHTNAPPFKNGSGRLELARAVVDPRNPLTARVMVNRVWMQHFGQPLVRTPSDFGLQSDPPSHAELLDHLATRFIRSGWSLKQLHRWIVESSTYRQAGESREASSAQALSRAKSTDSENRLLWHFPRRRLDLEAMRDTLVFISGRFDADMNGPSVRNMFDSPSRRRTLYAHLDRHQLPGVFRAFDFPSPDSTSPERGATTVTPQALFWMNHLLVSSVAGQIMARPELRTLEVDARMVYLHRLLYAREPVAEELQAARELLGPTPSQQRWEQYVHALLMANELVFVD